MWGHYHVIYALLLWHERSGDAAALAAARKAADLICALYLDTGRRVFDAGDPEMNMAILTGLAMLYRRAGEPRYLRMAREVEKDWERAGDYLRAGLDGREFFQCPRPRWESLHDLQGLLELWRITGEPPYRDAFAHHWRSIRRWDRRNTGGFSSGEQATGDPYAPTAIETCCTVAWMALTLDYLRLTGDPRAADELELSTLNGGLGAQHPSGRWWTYSTPMDGAREASAHAIVFQARAGTPELNCCSVNGPRVLGMLSEWAVMASADGLALNWLGAARYTVSLPGGGMVTLTSSQDAWRDGRTELQVSTSHKEAFTLRIRIPGWAQAPRLRLNGDPVPGAVPGSYHPLRRAWAAEDRLELELNPSTRGVAGGGEQTGKVSLYRGPVLLAFDPAHADPGGGALLVVDLARLSQARRVSLPSPRTAAAQGGRPWLAVDVPTTNGPPLRLVDFASAGAAGTRCISWLPGDPRLPAPAFTRQPRDGARVPPGPTLFQWRGAGNGRDTVYRIEFSTEPTFGGPPVLTTNVTGLKLVLDTRTLPATGNGSRVWWRVVACSARGETAPDVPPAWFVPDPTAPAPPQPPALQLGPRGELVAHALRSDAPPQFGRLAAARFSRRDATGTELNGRGDRLTYAVPVWPEEDLTVSLRLSLQAYPQGRLGQVFSAWSGAMDDPLRLVIENGRLFARIEAGNGYSTVGVAVATNQWMRVAVVKQAGTLTLYLDGRPAASCKVPEPITTRAQDCALGGNPHFGGDESLAARVADFRLYARALSAEEIQREGGGVAPAWASPPRLP